MVGTAIGVAMTGKASVDMLQDRSRHSLLDALEPDEWAKLAAFARREIYQADPGAEPQFSSGFLDRALDRPGTPGYWVS